MKEKGLSHETLKLIAAVTMLIDHIGSILVYSWYMQASRQVGMHMVQLWNLYLWMRIIGRIAFPIYCFLLVEGAYYTRNMTRYRNRMIVGLILAEIPFNLAFSGTILDFSSTSVMVTLLLGLLTIECMKKVPGFWKVLVILPFFLLAEWLRTDYAGNGISIIAMLALTKNHPKEKLLRTIGFAILLWFGAAVQVGTMQIPMELFGLFSLIPIFCYSGRKLTRSKVVQWAFYLFYPVHLAVLWLLNVVIFG